jgi:mannosyl-oligosaccharide glucosidase
LISQTIAEKPGSHKQRVSELYSKLRRNLVDTVYSSWAETGYAWEQYNSETGKGQRARPFTGWTSLIVEIIRMPDLVPDSSKKYSGHDEL